MAKTESYMMLELGTPAPSFNLADFSGKTYSLTDFKDAAALLVIFMCCHCPYVIHVRKGMVQMINDFQSRGVAVVGINSNDIEAYPQDGPESMAADAREYHYTFPFLLDETQEVAMAYKAACTPDFFFFAVMNHRPVSFTIDNCAAYFPAAESADTAACSRCFLNCRNCATTLGARRSSGCSAENCSMTMIALSTAPISMKLWAVER